MNLKNHSMKMHLIPFFGIIALFGLYSCANGKKLQQEAPMAFQEAYYIKSANGKDIDIFISSGKTHETGTTLDSVFFLGGQAKLYPVPGEENLFTGFLEGRQKTGFVMSADPKEEYGNQAPIISRSFPFELGPDEAVVSFVKGGKTGYYKIADVQERDVDSGKIKRPENIQH